MKNLLLLIYYKRCFNLYIKFIHRIDQERFLNAIRNLDDYSPEEENTWKFWRECLKLAKIGRKLWQCLSEGKSKEEKIQLQEELFNLGKKYE